MSRTKGSDDLFRLIHSLTKEEKGYFKKFTSRHSSDSLYVDIFDAILEQDKFEENSLQKKFKNYRVLKVYLFESILQSLMVYRQTETVKMELFYQYIYMDILIEKNLVNKARQIALRGAERAEAGEIFSLQYEFLRVLHSIEKNSWKNKDFLKNTQIHFKATDALFSKAKNAERYREADSILFFFDYARLKIDSEYGTVEKYVDPDFLKDQGKVLSRNGERHRLAALARYYSLIDKEDERCRIFEELFGFENKLAKQKSLLANHSIRTLALWGLVSAYLETRQTAKAEKLLNREWTDKYGKPTIADILYYVYFKVTVFWAAGKHLQGENFLEQNFDKLDHTFYNEKYHNVFIEIHKIRVMFSYSNNNFQKAALFIGEMQSMGLKKLAPIYYKDCEFLKILIQIKIGNYNIVQQLVSNILKRSHSYAPSPIEVRILHSLKNMNAVNKSELLKTIETEIRSSNENPNLMGVLLWKNVVANLINKVSLSEIKPYA